MNGHKFLNSRRLSVAGFSFLFAYILSFLFEGQVLYSLLDLRGTDADCYILAAIIAHFTGLFTSSLFVKSQAVAKNMMFGGMGLCLAATVPFFFAPSSLWLGGLIVSGYFSGCSVAAWGFFLRAFTPKNERIRSCADVLIYSNLLIIDCSKRGCHESIAVYWSKPCYALPCNRYGLHLDDAGGA